MANLLGSDQERRWVIQRIQALFITFEIVKMRLYLHIPHSIKN